MELSSLTLPADSTLSITSVKYIVN
jgi:hypothetical protein